MVYDLTSCKDCESMYACVRELNVEIPPRGSTNTFFCECCYEYYKQDPSPGWGNHTVTDAGTRMLFKKQEQALGCLCNAKSADEIPLDGCERDEDRSHPTRWVRSRKL